jgi:stage III sporulation protein AE
MKRLLALLLALALLTTTARAAALPEGVLPRGLAEAAETCGALDGGLLWLSESARSVLGGVLRDSARGAVLLVLAAMLCGAAEGLAQGAGGDAARYVPLCGVLASATLAAGDLRSLLGLGAATVEELGALARLLLPAVSAALASGGFVSTASVWQVTTLLVCDALCGAAAQWLLPLVYCHIAVSAADAMLGEGRLGMLADGLGKLLTGSLKLLVAVFAAYLATAGVLTGSADRAAVKAAKAAVSGAVPVVGGALSDAAEAVFAAAGAARGTAGTLGVFAILSVCLVPLLRLGVQFALYRAAAFSAALVGTKPLSDFLTRLSDAFALVFAMTAACAVVLLASMLTAVTITAG